MVILEHQEELSNTEIVWVRESKIRQSSKTTICAYALRGYSGQNFARVVRQICGASVEVIKRISKTFEMRKAKLFQSSKTTICADALPKTLDG